MTESAVVTYARGLLGRVLHGHVVAVRITVVEDIPTDPNGKYRYLVSHLPVEERSWASTTGISSVLGPA